MAETVPADERARVPVVTVLASMAGLWLCYFLLTTLRAAIVGFEPQVELLWRRGLVTLVGIGMTVLLWIILRLFDNRPLWAKILAAVLVAVPIAVPIAQTNQWIFADMQRKVEENFGRDRGINIRRDEAGNLLVDIPPERFRDLTGLGVSKDAAGAPSSVDGDYPGSIELKDWFLSHSTLEDVFINLAREEEKNKEGAPRHGTSSKPPGCCAFCGCCACCACCGCCG